MLYEFGNYALDTSKRLVTHDGEVLALPPKSFELLSLLLVSGGRALSKTELMQALWPGSFVEEANLSSQVSALRKTLGEDGAKWIETLPRHGYRFNAVVKRPAGATELPRDLPPAHPEVATPENLANRGRRHSPGFGSIPRAQCHPSLARSYSPGRFLGSQSAHGLRGTSTESQPVAGWQPGRVFVEWSKLG